MLYLIRDTGYGLGWRRPFFVRADLSLLDQAFICWGRPMCLPLMIIGNIVDYRKISPEIRNLKL